MEKLNKEELDKYYFPDVTFPGGDKGADLNVTLQRQGFKKAEQHYLKIIEDKNRDISRIQERRNEIQSEAERLKKELQQAKDLLKEAKNSMLSVSKKQAQFKCFNKIGEFLNKQL